MKQYRIFLSIIICVMLLGFVGSFFVLLQNREAKTDVVLLNDIAQTAKENLEHIEQMKDMDFGVPYVVLNQNNQVILNCSTESIKGMTEIMQENYPYMSFMDEGHILGYVAIIHNNEQLAQKQQEQVLLIMILSGAGMLIVMIAWAVYVEIRIARPFTRMRTFADQVAKGNLDMPLERDRNNIFGVYTESFDIMREELAKAREKEIQMKQREKEMIASLSHDLKTPITGIKLTAELLTAQTEEEAKLEKLDHIYKKAEQIDSLVSDLFTSTLKDLGEMQVHVRPENSQVLHEFVRRCDDQKKVKERIVPECMISIDNRRMEQIIGNILTNSYKYAGTPIEITYTIIEGYLKMSIRDYGAGVSEDELQLVTNKFYRSKKEGLDKIDGSGLGLYIAKMLMEKMSGEIRCLNANPGFEVWLLIPLA